MVCLSMNQDVNASDSLWSECQLPVYEKCFERNVYYINIIDWIGFDN